MHLSSNREIRRIAALALLSTSLSLLGCGKDRSLEVTLLAEKACRSCPDQACAREAVQAIQVIIDDRWGSMSSEEAESTNRDLGSAMKCADALVEGTRSVDALESACTGGEGQACAVLASRYRKGDGVAEDAGKAATLLQRGCNLGDLSACSIYGQALYDGNGVTQDIEEATQLFESGCKKGHGPACLAAAKVAAVKRDRKRARAYLERACDMKEALGCEALEKLPRAP